MTLTKLVGFPAAAVTDISRGSSLAVGDSGWPVSRGFSSKR